MPIILAAPKLLFIEPVPLVTIHSAGLATVKMIRGDMHFALFASQPTLEGTEEHIINHRQSMPLEGVIAALPLVIAAAAEATAQSAADMTKRLVTAATRLH